MQQTCTQCSAVFLVTEDDLAFYEEISPIVDGKKHRIPPPDCCPPCRRQRRYTWRNERSLYHRTCDRTQRSILSIYPADAPYTVYAHDEWWKDDWDPLEHGQDVDFSRPFFEQFAELMLRVPRPSIHVIGNENCDFVNQCGFSKNCYLSFNADWCEDCYYCKNTIRSRDCCDLLNCEQCELCYDSIGLSHCTRVRDSFQCKNTSDSAYCSDLIACSNCFGCVGLRNKQYCYFNEQLTRADYEKRTSEMASGSHSAHLQWQKMAADILLQQPHRCVEQLDCEQCTGDYLRNARNCHESYDCFNVQDIAYCSSVSDGNDFRDVDIGGYQSELCLEAISSGYHNVRTLFSSNLWGNVTDAFYSEFLNSSKHCFGCISLRHGEYCILNKQYTKQEYESVASKLIEHMHRTGEWGAFFPVALSPFAYNESVAMEEIPLTEQEVHKKHWRWRERKDVVADTQKTIDASALPDSIDAVPDDVLQWALLCTASGRPYHIIKPELDFYRRMELPLPRLHPDERYGNRLQRRNPRKLWTRPCASCTRDMQTSFAPDRPEIVLCEECYRKAKY